MSKGVGVRGFSLVELLVTIGVIGVLLSITLPALAGAREQAQRVRSVSNAREIGKVFQAHAEETGAMPFLKPGERGPGVEMDPPPGVVMVRWWPQGTVIGIDSHWANAFLWPGLVYERAPWTEHYATWVSPGRSTELPEEVGAPGAGGGPDAGGPERLISYHYSNSFVARPGLWRAGTPIAPSLIERTRPEEVAFPSNKVMVFDAELAFVRKKPAVVDGHWKSATPMVFADLHAESKDPTEAIAGFANPLNGGSSVRLHNTPEGVGGRDY